MVLLGNRFLGNRYYLACNRCLRQAGQKVGREEDKRTHGKGGKKMKKELGFIQHPISWQSPKVYIALLCFALHCSPPRSFFCKCILQAAIDFAEWRKRGWRRGAERRTFFGVAGFAPDPNFEQTFSAPTQRIASQPTTQIFGRVQSRRCDWFCGAADAELAAWQALHALK